MVHKIMQYGFLVGKKNHDLYYKNLDENHIISINIDRYKIFISYIFSILINYAPVFSLL